MLCQFFNSQLFLMLFLALLALRHFSSSTSFVPAFANAAALQQPQHLQEQPSDDSGGFCASSSVEFVNEQRQQPAPQRSEQPVGSSNGRPQGGGRGPQGFDPSGWPWPPGERPEGDNAQEECVIECMDVIVSEFFRRGALEKEATLQ
jgi:hypothetical protein